MADEYCILTRGPHLWGRVRGRVICKRCWLEPEDASLAVVASKPQTLTKQMQRVLSALEGAARLSETQIADQTGDPLPSVRRSIQQLIHMGHRVTYAGVDGCYALLSGAKFTEETAEPVEDTRALEAHLTALAALEHSISL